MSTFNGIVQEFPAIAIDFFRPHPGRRRPLACFLSHVHSDHLAGLETLRSPFVYCSAATREILLKLEKRPSRIAYAKGLREAPVRTYSHLKSLLKPIPLETPTVLELEPGNRIHVTLLDANHCPGAVMFLIEGDGKAILYTGDIRSEPWWVNSIARNPSVVEYSSGLRVLDRIYLDTSMLSNYVLQTKAEGLRELVSNVAKYPDDTVFCMQAWTYGYEEVWIALSKALNSKIHVDKYKMGVYRSLVAKSSSDRFALQFHHAKEAPYLVGFNCGNNKQEGCLTLDQNVRIHSCEKGTACCVMENEPVVWIQPIVAHLPDGQDVTEIGLGGGGDDLEQEADLGELTLKNIQPLFQMISESGDFSDSAKDQMKTMLLALVGADHPQIKQTIDDFSEDLQTRLGSVIWSMVRSIGAGQEQQKAQPESHSVTTKPLPNRIRFPYARHSSLPELQHLVETFKPNDIWPCTVDLPYWEERGITMQKLFGDFCSGDVFEHDLFVERTIEERSETEGAVLKEMGTNTQRTVSSSQMLSSPLLPTSDPYGSASPANLPSTTASLPHHTSQKAITGLEIVSIASDVSSAEIEDVSARILPSKRNHTEFQANENDKLGVISDIEDDSQASVLTERAYETRLQAFKSANSLLDGKEWRPIHLISTTDHHSEVDTELGHL